MAPTSMQHILQQPSSHLHGWQHGCDPFLGLLHAVALALGLPAGLAHQAQLELGVSQVLSKVTHAHLT